jgi:hypothetical protein
VALSDEDKAELRQIYAEGVAAGMELFESRLEEREAKRKAGADKDDKNKPPAGGDNNDNKDGGTDGGKRGLDFAGILLGKPRG